MDSDGDGGLRHWQELDQQQEMLDLAEKFRSMFEYSDGELIWKVKKGRARIGMVVNGMTMNGYKRVQVEGVLYLVHRVIYAMFKCDFPEKIDHVDNNKANNRIENLRPATQRTNMWNTKICSRNKSGVKGVSWCKQSNKWQVHIRTMEGNKFLGLFSSLSCAEQKIKEYREIHHGEFANHG